MRGRRYGRSSSARVWPIGSADVAAGDAFVVPTSWNGETVLRLCIVNPRTTVDDIAWIISSLEELDVR